MLKLNNFHVDESAIVELNGRAVVLPFIPAIVDILALNVLGGDNVDKMFHYLFSEQLSTGELRRIPQVVKLRTIKKIFKKQPPGKPGEAEDEYETTVDFSSMLQFLTREMNLSKHELLTRFTLSELIQQTSILKGKDDLPFFKHQKIAKSISDLQSLLN